MEGRKIWVKMEDENINMRRMKIKNVEKKKIYMENEKTRE